MLHQLAVLEGAGLGLVGVAAEVLGHLAAGEEGGLFAHREAGTAAAAQARVFELLEDLVLLQVLVGALEGLVAAGQAPVAVERAQRRVLGVLEQDPLLQPVRHQESPASPRLASAFSGSTSESARSCSIAVPASAASSGP